MKRILTTLLLIGLSLIMSRTSMAQENRYEARLGWIPVDVLNLVYLMGEDPANETSYGPMKTVGIFSADFNFKMQEWLSLGAKVNYRNSWRTMKNSEGEGIDRLQAFSVMPEVKFTTGFDSRFRYYASFGLGAGMDLSTDSERLITAWQITPVGIATGNRISWFLELGFGHAYNGLITGISWRF